MKIFRKMFNFFKLIGAIILSILMLLLVGTLMFEQLDLKNAFRELLSMLPFLFIVFVGFIGYKIGYNRGRKEGFWDGYRRAFSNPYKGGEEIEPSQKHFFPSGYKIGRMHGFEDVTRGYLVSVPIRGIQGDKYSDFRRGYMVGYWDGFCIGKDTNNYQGPNKDWYYITRESQVYGR